MRLPVLIAALLFPVAAQAAGVQQSGTVTPGHVAIWTTNGVAQDGGASSAGSLTSLGITSPNAGSFCINDALTNTGGWHALCAGTTAGGGTLSYTAYGNGSTSLPFNFQLNGTTALSIAPSGITFDLPLGLSSLTLSGAASVGGNLSVTGTATLSGGITSTTLLNFTTTDTVGFAFNGSGGLGVNIAAPSSSITGRLNISPGTSDNPITFNANNSAFANTSFNYSFSSATQQLVITPNISGNTYTPPASASWNCGGVSGFLTICNNGDALSSTVAPHSLDVVRYFGGSGTTGGRIAASFELINPVNDNTSDATNSFYQAINVDTDIRSTLGGTSDAYLGDPFASGMYITLEAGAHYVDGIALEEGDIAAQTGASVHKVGGFSVVLGKTNAVAGDEENYGFAISASSGATATLTCGYCLNTYDGVNPFASTAYVMQWIQHGGSDVGPTITGGIDLSHLTFTGNSWNDGHVTFDGSGEVNANSVTALSLSATDGFFDPPTTAGVPTGAPIAFSALAHCAIDTTNGYLNCYYGSAWHKIAFTSGAG